MNRILPLAALCLAPSFVQAHDFWMDFGATYKSAPSAPLAASFLVGHAGESEFWSVEPGRIVAFAAHGPVGTTDLKTMIASPSATGPGGAKIALAGAGSYVVAFETDEAYSDLEAEKFNEYIAKEGLAPAIAARKASKGGAERGREYYSRRAKSILQIGATPTDTVSKPIGHTLEIVPELNPLALKAKEPLPVRVYYEGKPLAGASVHLESLAVGLIPERTRVTDAEGRVYFEFPHNGAWKLDTIWTEPIDDPKAEFRTVFASLTFGY